MPRFLGCQRCPNSWRDADSAAGWRGQLTNDKQSLCLESSYLPARDCTDLRSALAAAKFTLGCQRLARLRWFVGCLVVGLDGGLVRGGKPALYVCQ